jgi:hypothetical protein
MNLRLWNDKDELYPYLCQMIIAQIIGGLGNQMFQCAAGLALAKKHGVPLLLDTRLFQNYDLRPEGFVLDRVFKIDATVAEEHEIRNLIGWRASLIGHRLMREESLSFLRGKTYYHQKGFAFNCEFLTLPSTCYFAGYWQTERYFKDEKELIWKQFTFKPPLNGKNKELANHIRQTYGAVSIHVRRGDYVSDSKTNAGHGVCGITYYQNAMRHIEKQVKNPVYFVFSDDVAWVRKHLPLDREHTFVDHNQGQESFNDMHLMSLCQHHIIANSSFSWWGAWLNSNPDQIVIAPKYWYKNKDWDSRDIAPENWEQL